jgi:hypothetical protein
MSQLQQFFTRLLEASGAVVEVIEPEGLDVIAPASVQRTLGLAEWARLGFGPDIPDDAQRITLESPMMESAVGELLGERGRYVRRLLIPSNPRLGDPERLLAENLDLRNATYRLEGVASAWTCYTILSFRCTAISDEKRESILRFGFNRANGATMDDMLPELLAGAEAQASPDAGGSPMRVADADHPAAALAAPAVRRDPRARPAVAAAPPSGIVLEWHVPPPGAGPAAAPFLSPGSAE